eukprot:6491412-Amphidinium_carterae.1
MAVWLLTALLLILPMQHQVNSSALPWFVPLTNTSQVTVADAVFQVINQISQCKHLRQFEGSQSFVGYFLMENVFDNPTFRKRALDFDILPTSVTSPRLISLKVMVWQNALSKMLVKRHGVNQCQRNRTYSKQPSD